MKSEQTFLIWRLCWAHRRAQA